MLKLFTIAACSLMTIATSQADARVSSSGAFWSGLDRNGVLSAGWVQVLPVLASACKLKLDSRELNAKLFDLSGASGNANYATNLYWHLYLMDQHRARNSFVSAWKARFGSNQKAACQTAEALWGDTGHQFPGVLKREAALDTGTTSTIPPNVPPDGCR